MAEHQDADGGDGAGTLDVGAIAERWKVGPGSAASGIELMRSVDPRATDLAPDRRAAEATSKALRRELAGLQGRLWAEGRRSLLLVLQAIDAGGKDSTVRSVFSGVDPQGVRVTSFKVPTELELAHDFLWRVHQAVPAAGEIAIFNRSHYEAVLVERVHGTVDRQRWTSRYEHIRAFESLLVDAGTTVLKVLLHISRDEQAERFRERLTDPAKHWKFRRGDLDDRARWDDFQEAFGDAVAATSTAEAPWFVVPADRKWYRDVVVLSILVAALRDMDPQPPPPEPGLDDVVIE